MKTSRLQKLAWVFFALALTSTTVLAQGNRTGNRYSQNQNATCLSYISNLSDKQQTQIVEMEEQHQVQMAELRTNRRTTINAIEKSEIRTEMLKKVEAHRNSVKKILNEEQKLQYDQLHAQGNLAQYCNYGNRRENGNFQGQRGNKGRGNGNYYRANNGRDYGNGNFQRGNGRGNRQNTCRGNYRFNNVN
jgi:hypothetical protein